MWFHKITVALKYCLKNLFDDAVAIRSNCGDTAGVRVRLKKKVMVNNGLLWSIMVYYGQ